MKARGEWPPELPKPLLYLHMMPKDPLGWDLRRLLSQSGMTENIDYKFSNGDHNGQVSIKQLNELYNCIDIYLSTAVGGGWELTVTEAMACLVPCILPAHSSLYELAGGGTKAYLLDEFVPISMPSDSIYRHMCHFEQVSEMILDVAKKIYDFDDDLERKKKSAYNWVNSLSWDNIYKKWDDIFNEAFF